MSTQSVLCTVIEFSNRIRCGRTKAWELVKNRQIASVKIGKQVFVPESAIIEFLERAIRPVFNAKGEAAALLDGPKASAIAKTARRKVAIGKSRTGSPEAA